MKGAFWVEVEDFAAYAQAGGAPAFDIPLNCFAATIVIGPIAAKNTLLVNGADVFSVWQGGTSRQTIMIFPGHIDPRTGEPMYYNDVLTFRAIGAFTGGITRTFYDPNRPAANTAKPFPGGPPPPNTVRSS